MHDTVFEQPTPTAPMNQPVQDCRGKLQTTSGTPWVGWAAATMRRSSMLRYYVTTAAGKVAVNWIQLCYN